MSDLCPNLDSLDVSAERQNLFHDLDTRAKAIEKRSKTMWLELASICITMRDNKLFREGGYDSFDSWLLGSCPCSRSMAYLAVGTRESLADMSEAYLSSIPLGNAQILADVPKQDRSNRLLEAARSTQPREFMPIAQEESPNSHLERSVKIKFTFSQWQSIRSVLDFYRKCEDSPELSDQYSLEAALVDYRLIREQLERMQRESEAGDASNQQA